MPNKSFQNRENCDSCEQLTVDLEAVKKEIDGRENSLKEANDKASFAIDLLVRLPLPTLAQPQFPSDKMYLECRAGGTKSATASKIR